MYMYLLQEVIPGLIYRKGDVSGSIIKGKPSLQFEPPDPV
jgi:hypothetical protein